VLEDGPFICNIEPNMGQFASDLRDAEFYPLTQKYAFSCSEWLFFGPMFSLKEYSHCESITQIKL
jgi:hypothetical protein